MTDLKDKMVKSERFFKDSEDLKQIKLYLNLIKFQENESSRKTKMMYRKDSLMLI